MSNLQLAIPKIVLDFAESYNDPDNDLPDDLGSGIIFDDVDSATLLLIYQGQELHYHFYNPHTDHLIITNSQGAEIYNAEYLHTDPECFERIYDTIYTELGLNQ